LRPNDHSTPSSVIVESPQKMGLTLIQTPAFRKSSNAAAVEVRASMELEPQR
jgi:hypothetical protein